MIRRHARADVAQPPSQNFLDLQPLEQENIEMTAVDGIGSHRRCHNFSVGSWERQAIK
jgi:hypothetical protein